MDWTAPLFNYCERAQSTDLLAEPFNAVTNVAFMIAAFMAFRLQLKQDANQRKFSVSILIALVFIIGVGSTLFHTFANRWSLLTDALPIFIFILAYLGFALTFFLKLPWFGILAGYALFFAVMTAFGSIRCEDGPCFNGTLGYAPALLSMFVIGFLLWNKKHPAGIPLLLAGSVFFVSAVFRSVDFHMCESVTFHTHEIGTHFLWHLFNAMTLYILLRAAILHSTPSQADNPLKS
ncbi:MAG: ceramidase domain-containing protein [Pseudomonadota bacterium]